MEKLFAYGTLLEPHIQMEVFGRELVGEATRLKNYRKIEVILGGVAYPSLQFSPEDSVEGILYKVSLTDLASADEYEGEEYQRILTVVDNGRRAWVFLT